MIIPVSPVIAGLYPVMVEVNTEITSSTSAIYHIKQQLVEVGDASEVPAPLGGYMIMGHRHYTSESTSYWTSGNDRIYANVVAGQTIGEAARALYKNKGAGKTTLQHVGGPNHFGECVGYAWGRSAPISDPWESVIFPPGTCVYVPPGNEWCQILTPQIILDYGQVSISPGGNQNLRKTEDISIECTAPMNVRVVFGEDVIKLGAGVQSSLGMLNIVDGKISLNQGINKQIVSSDLSVTEITRAGDYSGSTVAYITYH